MIINNRIATVNCIPFASALLHYLHRSSSIVILLSQLCVKYIIYLISAMNSCEIKSEECDFFQEYMDLEEFIDASTTDVTSPGSIQSPFGTDTSSCQILSATSVNEQHSLQGRQLVNKGLIGVQGMPNLNDLCQRKFTSCTSQNLTADKRNTANTLDCDSSLENGVFKDRRYWDRRLKNNIAAKRSRDAKRLKETTVLKRWTVLEDENKRLKEKISSMKRRLHAATGGENNLAV